MSDEVICGKLLRRVRQEIREMYPEMRRREVEKLAVESVQKAVKWHWAELLADATTCVATTLRRVYG